MYGGFGGRICNSICCILAQRNGFQLGMAGGIIGVLRCMESRNAVRLCGCHKRKAERKKTTKMMHGICHASRFGLIVNFGMRLHFERVQALDKAFDEGRHTGIL